MREKFSVWYSRLMTVRSLVWKPIKLTNFVLWNSTYELSHELSIDPFSFCESSWFRLPINVNHLAHE